MDEWDKAIRNVERTTRVVQVAVGVVICAIGFAIYALVEALSR